MERTVGDAHAVPNYPSHTALQASCPLHAQMRVNTQLAEQWWVGAALVAGGGQEVGGGRLGKGMLLQVGKLWGEPGKLPHGWPWQLAPTKQPAAGRQGAHVTGHLCRCSFRRLALHAPHVMSMSHDSALFHLG